MTDTRHSLNLATRDSLVALCLSCKLTPRMLAHASSGRDKFATLMDAKDHEAYCTAVADICILIHDAINRG